MPVTEKQKANLVPQNKRTQRERKEIARKGAEATNKVRAEKKTMRQLAEICLAGKISKPEMEAKLKEAGLPTTYGGQMLFNAINMAGKNSNMLRVVLELIGEIKQSQTNVVVNNVNPFAELTDDELRKLAKDA